MQVVYRLPCGRIHTRGRRLGGWPFCKGLNLVKAILQFNQIIHFQCLIARDGREFIQKIIHAYANAHKIVERFNSNPGSTKYRRSILDLRVNGD